VNEQTIAKKPYEAPKITSVNLPFNEIMLDYARACRAMCDVLRLPQTCWCRHRTGPHVWCEDADFGEGAFSD
jgi:hypothetical protein